MTNGYATNGPRKAPRGYPQWMVSLAGPPVVPVMCEMTECATENYKKTNCALSSTWQSALLNIEIWYELNAYQLQKSAW